MRVKKIHHINFLVKDIDAGIRCYQELLGVGEFELEALPQRGVLTARAALGEQWLVLVQPLDADSVPGRHLAEHGEGFFLISYAVDNLEEAANQVKRHGASMTSATSRTGLQNWQVQDIAVDHTMGAQIQFCEET